MANMAAGDYAQWREDEAVLAALGADLSRQNLRVTVTIPKALAEKAVQAWERDDEGVPGDETHEDARARTRAGTLALIGLTIQERGRWQDDHVVTELDSWYVGSALDAADDAGMISPAD